MTADVATLAADTQLTTVQLAKRLGEHPGAAKSHRMTINRWCTRGVTVAGRKIKLPAVRRGGKWLIRWGDYLAFQEKLTAAAGGEPARGRTPAQRRRAAKAARAELDAIFERAGV